MAHVMGAAGNASGGAQEAGWYNDSLARRTGANLSDSPGASGRGSHLPTEPYEMVLQPYSLPHLLATSIVLGTMILATIIGNVFVVAAIVLEKNLHSVTNYLIASLAVADLMVAALVMPLAAVNEVSKEWFLGPEVCDMWISFDVLCCTSSILHLVAIAMDRYWAVTRVDYIHNRTAKRILIMIALSWITGVCISIPPLFGWKDGQNDPAVTGECIISQDWGYTVFSTLGAFYLPLLLMMIIYLKIFRAAKYRIRKKNFTKNRNKNKDNNKDAPDTPRPLLLNHSANDGHPLAHFPSSVTQSPERSSNGSVALTCYSDNNRNNNKQQQQLHHNNSSSNLSPPSSPLLKEPTTKSSFLDITKIYLDLRKGNSPKKKERVKEKLEAKRERKAARTLGIITGTFIFCWLPFFILALVRPFCGDKCHYPMILVSIISWLGYFNSLLNPLIYTIFNPDFRLAFRKILFGKYRTPSRAGYR